MSMCSYLSFLMNECHLETGKSILILLSEWDSSFPVDPMNVCLHLSFNCIFICKLIEADFSPF